MMAVDDDEMAAFDEETGLTESELPDQIDVATVLAAIAAGGAWEIDVSDATAVLGWRPSAVRAGWSPAAGDHPRVLHVHMADRLRSWILGRLRAAVDAGWEVHVALQAADLYDETVLVALASLDAVVHVVRYSPEGTLSVSPPAAVLAAVADDGIMVSPAQRQALAAAMLCWVKHSGGSNYQRGRRLESLLCFLFSQVVDLDVVERNLRTDTEELDAVIQIRSVAGRVWNGLGAPMMLLEAKNWTNPVDQREISAFRVKLSGRRRSVRVGVMVGRSGFTSDATEQELRFASDDLTIALLDMRVVEDWCSADNGDEYIEAVIRKAMLR